MDQTVLSEDDVVKAWKSRIQNIVKYVKIVKNKSKKGHFMNIFSIYVFELLCIIQPSNLFLSAMKGRVIFIPTPAVCIDPISRLFRIAFIAKMIWKTCPILLEELRTKE